MTDTLHRFLFEDRPLRGEIVTLTKSLESILSKADYPNAVKQLLGELMSAASLLTATLKFEGEIALQIQSEGPVKYAIVNGTNELKLKGIARWDENSNIDLDSPDVNFTSLFQRGVLAITITPKNGSRYQGMVALDKENLALCLEDYFLQSEQLLTKIFLATQMKEWNYAGGLLLQIVPTSSETSNVSSNADFEHASFLLDTVTNDELFSLSHQQMITRLYHEENIRIFEPQVVSFFCDCSRERSASALKSIDRNELLEMIKEDGDIKMDCQFCHEKYVFDAIDIENLHSQNLASGNA